MKTEPFICVSSETFFTFTKRRLKEAQNVLLNLARYRPSNFGISTGILMHMIRATCHSPIVKLKYLNDALREVRFKEIMSDYGMFFLHDLDLQHHCILGIPANDPVACKEAMSRNGKGRKPLMVEPPPSSGPSGLYPIGESPAWAEIKAFIGRGAQAFMYMWVWDPDWDEVHETAAQLFVRFSREYFATLKDDALRADAPNPTCLEEAMEAWTVAELSKTLVSCWFVASNHGLNGKFPGARSLSFRDHARMFFPTTPDHMTQNSAWSPFLRHGYIGRYLRELQRLDDEDDQESLTDAIANIFGRLHCLPVIVAPTQRSNGKIWTTSHDGIHLLTNPMFYKLKRVGGPKANARVAANRLQRVKASNAVINRRLIEMNGGGAASAADAKRARKTARDRMKRLSTKAKNKRQPPDRWGKRKTVISPVSSEEEEEGEPDEEDKSDEEEEEEEDYDAMHVDELEEDEEEEEEEEDIGEDDVDIEL